MEFQDLLDHQRKRYNDLVDAIVDGVEYPDAPCHVVRLFGLTVREGEILTDMYDEYCEEGK